MDVVIATILIQSLVIAGLVVALLAVLDHLRGVNAHDQAVTRWADAHGGTDYMPHEGDEQSRGH